MAVYMYLLRIKQKKSIDRGFQPIRRRMEFGWGHHGEPFPSHSFLLSSPSLPLLLTPFSSYPLPPLEVGLRP